MYQQKVAEKVREWGQKIPPVQIPSLFTTVSLPAALLPLDRGHQFQQACIEGRSVAWVSASQRA